MLQYKISIPLPNMVCMHFKSCPVQVNFQLEIIILLVFLLLAHQNQLTCWKQVLFCSSRFFSFLSHFLEATLTTIAEQLTGTYLSQREHGRSAEAPRPQLNPWGSCEYHSHSLNAVFVSYFVSKENSSTLVCRTPC